MHTHFEMLLPGTVQGGGYLLADRVLSTAQLLVVQLTCTLAVAGVENQTTSVGSSAPVHTEYTCPSQWPGLGSAALFRLFCCWLVGDQDVRVRTWLRDSLSQVRVMNQSLPGKTLRRHTLHEIKDVRVYL